MPRGRHRVLQCGQESGSGWRSCLRRDPCGGNLQRELAHLLQVHCYVRPIRMFYCRWTCCAGPWCCWRVLQHVRNRRQRNIRRSDGLNKGLIRKCRTGDLVQGTSVGELTAYNDDIEKRNCHSACRIQGVETDCCIGGLIRRRQAGASRILGRCLLDADSGGGSDKGLGTPLSDSQMKQRVTPSGWDCGGTDGDGIQHVWFPLTRGHPEVVWRVSEAVPSVVGLPLEDACAALEQAGSGIGRIVCDYDHAIMCGCVITTHPYRIAPGHAQVDSVMSLGVCD